MKPQRMIEIAHALACNKAYPRQTHRLVAVGIRGEDGVLVSSCNGYPSEPSWASHAETKLIRKLTPDSVVAVVRILRDHSLAMAKPCNSCEKLLKRAGIKRVHYSITDNEFGTIIF